MTAKKILKKRCQPLLHHAWKMERLNKLNYGLARLQTLKSRCPQLCFPVLANDASRSTAGQITWRWLLLDRRTCKLDETHVILHRFLLEHFEEFHHLINITFRSFR